MLAKATKLVELILWAKPRSSVQLSITGRQLLDSFFLKHDLDVIQSMIYAHYVVVKA